MRYRWYINKLICDIPSLGLPAVITFAAHDPDSTIDNVPLPEACKRMEEAGADVVGLNCVRGPKSMLPLLQEIKNACKVSFTCELMTTMVLNVV